MIPTFKTADRERERISLITVQVNGRGEHNPPGRGNKYLDNNLTDPSAYFPGRQKHSGQHLGT